MMDFNTLSEIAVDGEGTVVQESLTPEANDFAKRLYRVCANGSDLLTPAVIDQIAKDFGTAIYHTDVQKNLTNLTVEIAKAKEDLQKALADNIVLKDQGSLISWTAKVEKYLANYPGKSTADLVGKILKLEKIDPALAVEQFAEYETVAKAMETSGLLKALGNSGEPDRAVDPMDKINIMATEIRKNETELTHEQAFAKAMLTEEGVALYTEWQEINKEGKE